MDDNFPNGSINSTLPKEPFHYSCPIINEVFQWKQEYLTSSVLTSSIVTAVLNGLLSIMTVVSNGLILLSILLKKRFRRSNFMILLGSMSLTDVLVGAVVQPSFAANRVNEILNHPITVCKLQTAGQIFGVALVSTSFMHIAYISIERYLAVRWSTSLKSKLTVRKTFLSVVFIWLICLTYAVLPALGYEEVGNLIGRSIAIAVFCTVATVCYSSIYYTVRASRRTFNMNLHSIAASKRIEKENKLAKTMLCTIGLLILCYSPHVILLFVINRNPDKISLVWIGLQYTRTVLFSNSLINPLWYCWRTTELRKTVLSFYKRQRERTRSK